MAGPIGPGGAGASRGPGGVARPRDRGGSRRRARWRGPPLPRWRQAPW